MSKTYKHIGYDDILNVSSRSGSPVDRMGNALTPANLNFEQDGDVLAARFNGTSSTIGCGQPHDLTGDISVCMWAKFFDFSSVHYLINNGRFLLFTSGTSLVLRPDGAQNNTGAYLFKKNLWYNIGITRSSLGVTMFYKNGVFLSTSSNGTPVAGTTDLHIGSTATPSLFLDGDLEPVIIKPRILTAAEIMQYYTQTRRFYENH